MAYSFLSRFRVKADRDADFVKLCREMEGVVHLEPGTLGFKFFRLDEPGMFAVYESFVDEAADKAHQETDHGRPIIVVFRWDVRNPSLPVWSQAFSTDEGKTWEWNSINVSERVRSP